MSVSSISFYIVTVIYYNLFYLTCNIFFIWRATSLLVLLLLCVTLFNPLRPNNDLSQTSHCNIKGLSVSEVTRIDNMITQVRFY